ncbi:helix-turn-helix domain-containing protein [Actinomadura barringtoniae]|uniref:Helix-turn-helix domain-containing protein n=1 Tax=Actinomadura barringtoniae TaxID=1427535 RepID=A0A939PLB0_9ACTN|nr:helix-turn-helix domain-containing protein [Actinomadura barringtoniae]MBO2454427.1 helix-turn-helix domain-containing protein [Actinomadura barringtoniae]
MTSEDPSQAALQPPSVSSEEEFVVALRILRERSGLTFKEIERRTSASDSLVLPASTLATALHRRNAPRPEVVAALVKVCGGDEAVVAEWLAAREALIHPLRPDPEPPQNEHEVLEKAFRKSGRRAAVVLFTIIFLVAAVSLYGPLRSSEGSGDDHPPPTPSPTPATTGASPKIGTGLLKLSGFCLSEHEHDQTGRVYLSDCKRSFPPRALKPFSGFWRVTTDHPQFGAGCMGVVDGSLKPGVDMSDDTCDRVQTDLFLLEHVTGGYLLQPNDHHLCVGVEGKPKPGAKLKQIPCNPQAPGQIFTIN